MAETNAPLARTTIRELLSMPMESSLCLWQSLVIRWLSGYRHIMREASVSAWPQ